MAALAKRTVTLVLSLGFIVRFAHADIEKVRFPLPRVPAQTSLVELKKLENEARWEGCTKHASKIFPTEKKLKGWVLRTWLHCASRLDLSNEKISPFWLAALKAAEAHSQLRYVGPWAGEVQSLLEELRFLIIERGLKTKDPEVPRLLDTMIAEARKEDREQRAKFLAKYGEWALALHQPEAAYSFFQQSLAVRESAELRARLPPLELTLNIPRKVESEDSTKEEFTSAKEKKLEERMALSQKNNDLLGLIEDCVSYLNQFPGGKKSKWAAERVQDLGLFFMSPEKSGDEKWSILAERALSLMSKADASRLAEWAKAAHRVGFFSGSLYLSEKSLSKSQNQFAHAKLLYISGRSAQLIGQYAKAQRYLEDYSTLYSAGEEISEVLFRLGSVSYRQGHFSNAVASFERLLSNSTDNKYELVGRYWLIRSLQGLRSARAKIEIETFTQKYPFTYYGLKLRAEANQGVLAWPYAVEGTLDQKGELALTQAHRSSLDRIDLLATAGWFREAALELATFPDSQDHLLRYLLAREWRQRDLNTGAIKLINMVVDQGVDYRTQDVVSLAYPRPFSEAVQRESMKYNLNPVLVWSLMRQESAFDPWALSSSSAMGLMQLIPSTAKEVASQLKLGSLELPDEVYIPDRNVSLGTSYLAQMLKAFKGCVPLALGAYNAGPTRMGYFLNARVDLRDKLLNFDQRQSMDELWIDELPWGETSFYIKAILRNSLIYRMLETSRVQLSPNEWQDLAISPVPDVKRPEPGSKGG